MTIPAAEQASQAGGCPSPTAHAAGSLEDRKAHVPLTVHHRTSGGHSPGPQLVIGSLRPEAVKWGSLYFHP